MKKVVQVLVLALFIASCGMQGGLQRNKPGSNLEWGSSKSSKNQDINLVESVDLEKEITVNGVAKKINSNPKVLSQSKLNDNDLASNSKNIGDLEDLFYSNSKAPSSTDVKSNYTSLSSKKQINKNENKLEKRKEIKKAINDDVPIGLLYLLCFIIPWVAVGFATNWDIKIVIYNILWSFLFGLPGIIHAIIVVRNNN